MKKAVVIRAFSQSSNFLGSTEFLGSLEAYRAVFERAANLGFQGVQLYTEISDGFVSLDTPDATLKELGQAARAAGIELPSLEIAPLQFSLTSEDEVVRAEGRRVVRRAMEMAVALEAPGVLLIPGYVGLPWVKGGGTPVHYEDAYGRTLDALRSLAQDAGKLGVSIHLENIWNMFLLSPLEMRRLIDETASPHVGVLFDTGNVTLYGFAEQWIRILGSRIREVHLKDYRRAVGTVEGFVPLLAGDVNWPAVMGALRETGYKGFLIAEAFPYDTFGDTMLTHLASIMDRLMEGV